MVYFEIREKWNMIDKEFYFSIRKNLLQVKKYIKEWIESWKENCEENEYKWKGSDTDYKTFAVCKILREKDI